MKGELCIFNSSILCGAPEWGDNLNYFLMIFHFFFVFNFFLCLHTHRTSLDVLVPDDPQKQKTFNFHSVSMISFLVNFSASSTVPQLNAIPTSQQPPPQLELIDIPPPLDLNAIPKPESLKLETIRVPPVAGSSIKVPTTKEQLIELVAANGDGYEENLITQFNRNDLSQPLR